MLLHILDQDCVGACHLKNYCFVITYLLEDEQELSLGMLIRLKRIYNFWCSMLVLHQFLYILFTLRCTFMHFPELTYWQDATVPVPVFCCFWIPEKLYRKYSRNGTKQKPKFLISRNEDGVRRGVEEAPRGGLTCPRRKPRPGRT